MVQELKEKEQYVLLAQREAVQLDKWQGKAEPFRHIYSQSARYVLGTALGAGAPAVGRVTDPVEFAFKLARQLTSECVLWRQVVAGARMADKAMGQRQKEVREQWL